MTIDGSISIMLIAIIAAISCFSFVVIKIKKKKPELLRNSLIQLQNTDNATTINWVMVQSITIAAITFGTGVYTIGGILIFFIYKELVLDGLSIIILTIVFFYFICTELDKFITKYIK